MASTQGSQLKDGIAWPLDWNAEPSNVPSVLASAMARVTGRGSRKHGGRSGKSLSDSLQIPNMSE